MAKLRDLHAGGIPISFDSAFFHFGGGMVLRNLCRERLPDKELTAYARWAAIGTIGGARRDRCFPGVRVVGNSGATAR